MKIENIEEKIVWENQYFYVFQLSSKRFELRKLGVYYSEVCGSGSKEACIRTAEKLSKYPKSKPERDDAP
jgi:hypothetical protein